MADSDPSTWQLPRIRIARDGTWLHEGEEVTHPGILANLRGNLRVDDEGHYLQIGPARVPVEVEDAPFVILRVEREGDRLVLTVNDLSRETLSPGTLRFGPDGVPYCRVRDGRFEARLSRAAAYQLLQHVEYDEGTGRAMLVLGTVRHALPGLAR
ncbi:MAG TPA: DUF1285 domain-containing protein [Methylomirabilota bacterium]|jgi:hypothetical protein|nr:DUF1285 domain-containing protein [Methylomirabilota bacterium]